MTTSKGAPRAFLCHSSEDAKLVERLATALKQDAVEAWYAPWRISPGESLRRKIEGGIDEATHFFALLTPASLQSEWAQTELDAALVKRIEGALTLIPVLYGIAPDRVPTTLKGLKWVSLDPFEKGLRELVNACHGVSDEPPLGKRPERLEAPFASIPMSRDAARIAEFMANESTHGHKLDIHDPRHLLQVLDLEPDEFEMAADELQHLGLARLEGRANRLMPEWYLFWEFDPIVKGWSVKDDAEQLAVALVNSDSEQLDVRSYAEEHGWGTRRANPTCAYLDFYDVVGAHSFLGGGGYFFNVLFRTPATKRFVRDLMNSPS